jgi:chromosomal replication initiation ATPase DnaA
VMRAKAEGRSDTEKKTLAHVQQATKAEIERYRHYSSAEELVTNFQQDLHSDAAEKVHAELRSLHLPTIEDIRDEFERKASQLGVRA